MDTRARSAIASVPLEACEGSPLRRGSVKHLEGIAPRAHRDRLSLEGAVADRDLEARLLVHLFDPTGTRRPVTFATAWLRTDADGDGSAVLTLRPDDVPSEVRGAPHGVRWDVTGDGAVLYRTACTTRHLG